MARNEKVAVSVTAGSYPKTPVAMVHIFHRVLAVRNEVIIKKQRVLWRDSSNLLTFVMTVQALGFPSSHFECVSP